MALGCLTLDLWSPRLRGAQSNIVAKSSESPATNNIVTDYRLKWNVDTLVGDYEKHGRHSPKWDSSAKAALLLFAQVRTFSSSPKGPELLSKLEPALKAALTNDCDDPLLLYLGLRFVTPTQNQTREELAEQYRKVAESLSRTDYTPIRKFYTALRASQALNPGGTNTPQAVHEWRRTASRFLNEGLKDTTMPPTEVYEACDALLKGVNNNYIELEQFYSAFEPIIFKNWPSESSLYLLKGDFYKNFAWQARGGAYANKVTETGWKLFAERLAEAEKALAKAWQLNPKDERIACLMISVELGQGKGRSRMEMWFDRATDLNPNYYDAFTAKLYYLEPKWYGSPEEMLDFGHQCVNSKKWGGHVPLILRDAHEAIARYLPKKEQEDYWKRPDVWTDIHEAFEKFFKLNPDENGWRHNYALYAYKAEQWSVLNRQIPLLGEINYEFFGGKDAYAKMVRLAKEHASSK